MILNEKNKYDPEKLTTFFLDGQLWRKILHINCVSILA